MTTAVLALFLGDKLPLMLMGSVVECVFIFKIWDMQVLACAYDLFHLSCEATL